MPSQLERASRKFFVRVELPIMVDEAALSDGVEVGEFVITLLAMSGLPGATVISSEVIPENWN